MFFVKLEFFNFFSRSIKDRVVFNFVMKVLKCGDINGIRWFFEVIFGNVGIVMVVILNIFNVEFRVYLLKLILDVIVIFLKVFGVEVVKMDFEVIDREMIEFVRDEVEKVGVVNLN